MFPKFPWCRVIAIIVVGCSQTNFAPSLEGADAPRQAVLHLVNGGYIPGEMQRSDAPDLLRWRSPHFSESLEFPLSALSAVHYPQPKKMPKPQGEYCFELVGDDILYGVLRSLSDDELEVESVRFGRLHLRRDRVQRFYRWHGEELIYLGPMGLDRWKESKATPLWRDTGGMPFTDKPGASIYGDFGIPEKAVIEFDLSWTKKPDFMFALGVGSQPASLEQAFRFEVWDNQLVAIGESKQDADVAPVMRVGTEAGNLRVQAYVDQKRRIMLLYSAAGEAMESLHIKLGEPQVNPGLRLVNKRGDLRLERLRISRWDGVPPAKFEADQARLHRGDGTIVYGQLIGYDADTEQFTVLEDGSLIQMDAADVNDVFLAAQPSDSELPKDGTSLRVSYHDGSRMSGVSTEIEGGQLTFQSLAVRESLPIPEADRRSLIAPPHEAPSSPESKERSGRLEIDGLSLKGRLINGAERPDASCLVWQPDLASKASALVRGLSGRVVYYEPPPRPSKPVINLGGNARRPRRQAEFGQVFKMMMTGNLPTKPNSTQQCSLHLRSGDTIPCEVASIDELGVTFSTPLSDATFVSHTALKAIEFNSQRNVLGLKKEQRSQLLTLPRMLRDAPPKHLVCSRNADFLRGRILEMDDKLLKIEVRLETKEIPRDRLANLIWFHEDELNGAASAEPDASTESATRVQTVRRNGNRLTFTAETMDEQVLIGKSDILGDCQVDMNQIDQLLFGAFIEKASANLAFHRWKLQHAKDPKFVEAGSTPSSGPTGTESPLVGEPAPDIQLDFLEGGKFNLSKYRGRVVVLDFWATWCGPCLQTMPIVDSVVEEYADQGIELIAVNLEEQPSQIKSMLERHKLAMKVALDRNGVVAARYAVTAIPQTVVIDREGRVARLFVGGGAKLAEPLREALQELVGQQAF